MTKNFAMLALLALMTLHAFAAPGYDPSRDGRADLLDGLQSAKLSGKLVLVLIGGDWCPPCKALDRTMSSSSEIQRLVSERYVLVKINYSAKNKNKKATDMLPFFIGYPKVFVLNADGTVTGSLSLWSAKAGGEFDAAALHEVLAGPVHGRPE